MENVKMSVSYGAPVNETFQNSDGWTCTLKYHGKQMTIPFYKGYGHNGKEPNVKEVLNALFLDASSFDNARDFEDFCSEFGYDSDSRRAEKIYKECGKISDKLKRLFGSDYNSIAEEVSDY